MRPADSPTPVSSPIGATLAIRGGALRAVGYAGGVLLSLGAAAILLRSLGIAGFGRYTTVTSLIALVGGMTEAGIVVYGIREFVDRDEAERRLLLSNLLTMRLVLASIGVFIAVLFGLAFGYRNAIVLGLLIAGAGLLAQVCADVLSISLQAQLQLGRLTAIELVRRGLTLALIGAFAALGADLLPFLAASALAAVVALGLVAWATRTDLPIRLAVDRKLWRKLLADTLPFAIALSVAAVYIYVTMIIMSLIATAHQTGLFATSLRVIQAGLVLPSLLLTAIFPLISRARAHMSDGSDAAVAKIFTVAVVCGVWMSLATALGAEFIIRTVAGDAGAAAVPVLRIQALIFIASFVSTSSALRLIALRRYPELILVSILSLALNIALALVLIPALGARGGAAADVMTEAIAAVGLTTLLLRSASASRLELSFLAPLFLACAASASVLLMPIGSLAQAICATAIYFAVLLLTHTIPSEVIEAARRGRSTAPRR